MDSPRDTQTQSEGQVAATSLVSGISSKKEDTPKKGYPQTVKKGNSTAKFMKAVKVETLASAPPSTPPIRTSQRQIKRPKTDDELIDFESSSRGSTSKKIKTSLSSSATPKNPTTASKTGSSQKKAKPKFVSAAKDLGRWRPPDDLMLISAVLQTNDLAAVHLGVKFSCRFTLKEIEERWYALLYEPQISKLAIDAIRSLHPGVVTMALNNALWSQDEEICLSKIPSSDPGHLKTFQQLLADCPAIFHPCRSATSLHHHWVLMGHYNLLCDQHVDVVPPVGSVVNFSDAEDLLNDLELMKSHDVKEGAVAQELMIADRQAKKEILAVENELPVWSEILNVAPSPVFDEGVLAILKGRVVQFMMRAHEVTIGRKSESKQVTFDLSLEGPAYKISRHQATMRLSHDGIFTIKNEGRRPLYIGGHAVVTGEIAHLQDNQVLEVATFSLLILLNQKVLNIQ